MKTQLTRSMTNKKLGGVAGGIAEAFGWDPTLVRLGFVLLTLAHGGGLLLYLILMLVLPKADRPSVAQQAVAGMASGAYHLPSAEGRNRTLGYVLLGVGGIMLVSMLPIPGPVIALLIVGAGWHVLRKR
ncbi:MAG: PspC domain-containing protein [Pseudomonadota bacterium]|nr:PspC domain-containing protein [Pseudomonadota bacterium]